MVVAYKRRLKAHGAGREGSTMTSWRYCVGCAVVNVVRWLPFVAIPVCLVLKGVALDCRCCPGKPVRLGGSTPGGLTDWK